MTTELWQQTKDVCLSVAALELRCQDASNAKDMDRVGRLRAKIEERKREGSPWWIKVQHIGTPEQPFLWEDISGEWSACADQCRCLARAELINLGDDAMTYVFGEGWQATRKDNAPYSFSDAVGVRAYSSKAWRDGFSVFVRDTVIHGCVGGEETYKRVYAFGGSKMLLLAFEAVKEFNSVSDLLGED